MLEYVPGKGFSGFTNEENESMNKLGIGRPPVSSPVVPVQPIQQVVPNNAYMQQSNNSVNSANSEYEGRVYMSDDEIKARVDRYFNDIGVSSQPAQTQQTNTNQQQASQQSNASNASNESDLFGSWLSGNDTNKIEPNNTANASNGNNASNGQTVINAKSDDGFIGYRRSIVEASIKLGVDPSAIERTLANMTPEDHAIFASIKLEKERQGMRQTPNAMQANNGQNQPMNPNLRTALDTAFKRTPSPDVTGVPSLQSNGNYGNTNNGVYNVVQSKIDKLFRG